LLEPPHEIATAKATPVTTFFFDARRARVNSAIPEAIER
jgi:hypothetical protein